MIRLTLLLLAALLPPATVVAQTNHIDRVADAWTAQSGVYVTKQTKRALADRVSEDTSLSQSLGKASSQVSRDESMVAASRVDRTGRDSTIANASPTTTDDTWRRLFTVENFSFWLQSFPTIQLRVQPIPPREYTVTINGEVCPLTEAATYRVPAGTATVRVERVGVPACVRSVALTGSGVFTVECTF